MIRGDRQPIGGKHHDLDRKFTNQTFKISRGDSLFLTSDGFVDQFGGPNNKKFLKKRLSELINANCKYSMQAQSFIYKKAFEDWKGSLEQIDDVSFMGIKFWTCPEETIVNQWSLRLPIALLIFLVILTLISLNW